MAAYHIEKTAVSPEDAVRISSYMTMSTGFKVIPAFVQAVVNLIPYTPVMGSQAAHHAEILMAIWTAGRIQGIREERQRRRARKEAKVLDNSDLWNADDETIDNIFNSLAPSRQRHALVFGLCSLALQR